MTIPRAQRGFCMWDVTDTIASLASAPGGAARGLVRISGPSAAQILARCLVDDLEADSKPVTSPSVRQGQVDLGAPLGRVPCRALFWPNERSYTRQPVLELHTLGSPPLLNALLRQVCENGARVAEPGEFTLRAFLAGRIDLVQAEAVLGVIDAAGERELRTALAQLAGGLSAPLAQLRESLLNLLAHLEAGLDFVEEDIEFITRGELERELADAERQVERLAAQMAGRGTADGVFRVVLVGAPNVGKSSLFNALCQESAALVASVAGTTRDYVSRTLALGGIRCELIDTAGVEAAEAMAQPQRPAVAIGALAQQSTAEQWQAAELQLFCLDHSRGLTPWEERQLAAHISTPRLVVLTHGDRARHPDFTTAGVLTSSMTGAGLAELGAAVAAAATTTSEASVVAATAVRSRESVRLAGESLARARAIVASELGQELVAAEVRAALEELGQVTGALYTDDLLDRIFSRFCIGK